VPNATEATSLRVVLDSNVLVSALAFPGGVPYQVLQLAIRGDIAAAVSTHILTEVEEVLRGKLRVGDSAALEALALLRERCSLIDPPPSSAVPGISPDDNRVLDCALASEAQYLVTGDRAMLRLEAFEEILVISPATFLEILRTSGMPQ
jgi:putative PIN family toxin of toxin-antitoxin system